MRNILVLLVSVLIGVEFVAAATPNPPPKTQSMATVERDTNDKEQEVFRRCNNELGKDESKLPIDKRSEAYRKCYTRVFEQLNPSSSSSTQQDCRTAETTFNEARDTFFGSCKGGEETCWNLALACTVCTGNGPLAKYCPGADAATKKRREEFELKSKGEHVGRGGPSIVAVSSCPTTSAEAAKTLEKDVEKYKRDKNTLIRDIEEAQANITKIENGAIQAKIDYEAAVDAITTKRDEDSKKYRKDETIKISDSRKRADEIVKQMSQLIGQIQIEGTKKNQAISALERECHNKALDRLTAYLADRRANIKVGNQRATQKDILKTVNQTTKQRNQNYAEDIYKACIADRNHTDRVKDINDTFALAVSQIDSAVSQLKAEQAGLAKTIVGEEAQKEFYTQMQSIFTAAQKKIDKATADFQAAVTAAEKEVAQEKAKVERYSAELKTAQATLTHKEALWGAAEETPFGNDDNSSKFLENYNKLYSKANYLYSVCSCHNADNRMTSEGVCKSAREAACAQKTAGDGVICTGEDPIPRLKKLQEQSGGKIR